MEEYCHCVGETRINAVLFNASVARACVFVIASIATAAAAAFVVMFWLNVSIGSRSQHKFSNPLQAILNRFGVRKILHRNVDYDYYCYFSLWRRQRRRRIELDSNSIF